MAAPQKDSLDYFPLDCGFFEDKTIKGLRVRFQNDGIAVYLYLLCIIYRDNGYYTEFDEDLLLDVTDTAHISEETAKDIVNHLTARGLFDKELADSKNILTSRSIQRRYQKGKIRTGSRRKVEVNSEYWLLTEKETEQWINVVGHNDVEEGSCQSTSPERHDILSEQSEQKPAKYSIVKDSIVEDSIEKKKEKPKAKAKPKEKTKKNFADDVTLTEEEYKKLLSEFSEPFVNKCIEVLNNYKLSSGRKYKSDYYAIRNWVIGEVQKRYPQINSMPVASLGNGNLPDKPWG